MRTFAPFFFALLLLGLPRSPAVRADAAPSEYEQSIQRAIVEFEAGNWDEARALFRRAHELSPNARTWRGLGITAFELRRYVDAIHELEAALGDAQKPLTEQQRSELTSLLARTREFVSTYHLTLQPSAALLLIDGRPGELHGAELTLDPGSHTLSLRAPGYAEQRIELRADAGQHESISITLQAERGALSAVERPVAKTAPTATNPEAPKRLLVLTWTLAGAGVLALASAIPLGLVTKDEEHRYKSCGKSDAECDRIRVVGKRHGLAANVMFGVAGACALSAALSYFLERRRAGSAVRSATLSIDLRAHTRGLYASLPF